jgi:hypothetical protein
MATGRQKRLGALRTRVEKTPNHARLRLDVLGAGRAGGDRNPGDDSDRIEVRATIGDAGELDASRLEVETASVTAAGRSSSVFHARKSLSVIPRGDARVEYLGAPQIYELASGGARVVRRRSTPAQGPSRP